MVAVTLRLKVPAGITPRITPPLRGRLRSRIRQRYDEQLENAIGTIRRDDYSGSLPGNVCSIPPLSFRFPPLLPPVPPSSIGFPSIELPVGVIASRI